MDNQITTLSSSQQRTAMLGLAGLFFLFGFVTWLNGALIPYLQIICDLSESQALLVASSFYIAYVVMALPMSYILEKVGLKQGMAIGLALIALGVLCFIPAAILQAFWLFLLAQFVVGTGLTILQTASNPYLVIAGPNESAAARIAVMGILNKFAGVLAPVLFTALILSDFGDVSVASISQMSTAQQASVRAELSQQLIQPYLGLAVVIGFLALVMIRSPLPDIGVSANARSTQSMSDFPLLQLGVVTLFFYVGVEVIAGDTIGLFGSALGLSNSTSLTAYTMAFMVLGYVIGLLCIPRFINQSQALLVSAWAGGILCVGIAITDIDSFLIAQWLWGWTGIAVLPDPVVLVALLGLANAMVWPCVWPLAIKGLGDFTARGSAFLIMGIAGGAILPPIFGELVGVFDYQRSYLSLIIGYWVIGYFAYRTRLS